MNLKFLQLISENRGENEVHVPCYSQILNSINVTQMYKCLPIYLGQSTSNNIEDPILHDSYLVEFPNSNASRIIKFDFSSAKLLLPDKIGLPSDRIRSFTSLN